MPSLLSNSRKRKPDRRIPSLALRAGIMGGMALLLFAILIFRIWFLQILSGDQYVAMAENNRIRFIVEEAPRGIVYDRNKKPLVDNRAGLAVTVFPPALSNPAGELTELSQAIDVPVEEITKQIDLHKADTYRSVVIKKDITPEQKSFLIERIPLYFPGVDIKKFPLRDYPAGVSATHVLGHVGQIDEQDLADPHYAGHKSGDEVGKDGVEFQFDQFLKGIDGGREVEVDSAGRPKREVRSIQAQPGSNVVLSLDSRVQKATEDALVWGIDLAHEKNYKNANGGAAVLMNPKTGEIYAMASFPTYDPKVWVGGISDSNYAVLNAEGANDPLLNRAIAGQYPAGSTFKVVTSIAGLQEGIMSTADTVNSTGSWHVPGDENQIFHDWSALGVVDLHRAIVMSCDTYFYEMGYRFYQNNSQGLQRWARQLGMGAPTGIDLPGEAVGRVPDPEWKQSFGQTEIDQMWLPGDNVNLAIGQGDLLATPLQVATLYSKIANGGRDVRPHTGLWVEDPVTGKMVADLRPELGNQLPVSMENLRPVQEGLADATGPGATVGDTFVGSRIPVAGKTGTAQVTGKTDYAWYAAYAPVNDPQVVVLVMIEQGGGGGSVAAPTARKIIDDFFLAPPAALTAPEPVTP